MVTTRSKRLSRAFQTSPYRLPQVARAVHTAQDVRPFHALSRPSHQSSTRWQTKGKPRKWARGSRSYQLFIFLADAIRPPMPRTPMARLYCESKSCYAGVLQGLLAVLTC
jgi:hypothetical protein